MIKLLFVFIFLCSAVLKAASPSQDEEEFVIFGVPAADTSIALSWIKTEQDCRRNMALFIDHTENLLSLTEEAIAHLTQTKKLHNYAPLLGIEADNFAIQIKPIILETYVKALENNTHRLRTNCDNTREFSQYLAKMPSGDILAQRGFMGHALITTAEVLDGFKERSRSVLAELSNPSSIYPLICIGDYENLLPIEMLPTWRYEKLHQTTRWNVVKKLWDFLNKWDPDLTFRKNAAYVPIVNEMTNIVKAFGNLPYLQGTQTKPNIESLETNVPLNILKMENVFEKLRIEHSVSKKYREDLHRRFAKRAARKEKQKLLPISDVPLPSLDDLIAEIGGNDEQGKPAKPKKEKKVKQKTKAPESMIVEAPDPKAQAKRVRKDKKKAAIDDLVKEVALAAIAPVAEAEIKVTTHYLSPDQQRRRKARESRQCENEAQVAASAQAKAALEERDTKKSKAEREREIIAKKLLP